jgi:anti-sigma factor RsiW
MNCKEIHELLPDVAAGMAAATPEVKGHIAGCAGCAAELEDFKKTMALLDEWQAPEPSAYFDVRLEARLREEMARPAMPWYRRWVQGLTMRPAWSMSVAAVLFTVAIAAGNRSYIMQMDEIATAPPTVGVPAQPGTAVADLQALESNHDLYADFDVLDELQVQDEATSNP